MTVETSLGAPENSSSWAGFLYTVPCFEAIFFREKILCMERSYRNVMCRRVTTGPTQGELVHTLHVPNCSSSATCSQPTNRFCSYLQPSLQLLRSPPAGRCRTDICS
ncbi:unnamed protein product [Ectocarpus fasciculatus]